MQSVLFDIRQALRQIRSKPGLESRIFTEADDLSQPLRAVINQHIAETLWPAQPAVGQQIIK